MDDLGRKIKQLTPEDQRRAALILHAVPQMISLMMSCAGPHDALIALSAAMCTVFHLADVRSAIPEPQAAELTFQFVVEALIARKKGESHET
jgi:hypothetical protein